MSKVKPKLTAKIAVVTAKIINLVIEAYRGVNMSEMKGSTDFVLHLCNIVEYKFHKVDKVDKKKIVLDIFKRLIPSVTESELETINQTIEHLHSTGQIKYPSLFKLGKEAIIDILKTVLCLKK